MKKIILALVAFMLVLGMTQCKKEQPTPTPEPTPDGETVYISMKVDDGGAKHIVYPGTGAYVFETGDVIYVGNNGRYVGTLTYANGTFSGSITSPSTDDYLHFYFTGGKTPATAPTAGSTTSFTVDISDQSSKLPVLSYGHSTTKYIDGTTAYTCMLENQCGLVKFRVINSHESNISTSKTIRVSGVKTTANINFTTPGITPTDATGMVTLYSDSKNESLRWAILLPQEEVTYPNAEVFFDYVRGSVRWNLPAVTANMYYTLGVKICEPVAYQINANGDKVYFSQGNLQYTAFPSYWKFADNQWDVIGTGNHIGVNWDSHDIDLFGWGTSGWNSGANNNSPYYYQPTDYVSTKSNGQNIGEKYGPGNNDLTGDYANADWGVYNPIRNGGNVANAWRTLTKDEWKYLLEDRPDASLLYGFGSVNGVKGLFLRPERLTFENFTPGNSAWVNEYTLEQWQRQESLGYIFLPAAGYRKDKSVYNVNERGYYWSAKYGNEKEAYRVSFEDGVLKTIDCYYRSWGYAVRLVQDVE